MPTPLTLALDCTQSGLHLAVAGGPLFAPVCVADPTPRAADNLHTTLHTLLTQHHLKLADVTRVVTTIGPGSFTGIRMGLAVGAALKLLNPQLELIGLGSLEALAVNLLTNIPTFQHSNTSFTIATDAAGGSLYVQTFHADGTPADQPRCTPALTYPNTDRPTYTPAFCLLLPNALPLPSFNPTTLLTMATNPANHRPFAPLYVKDLTYKASA